MVEVECTVCGKKVFRRAAEVNRSQRMGRRPFCSAHCSAVESNMARKRKEVVKTCPHCGGKFISDTGNKAATYCSRSCASKGSMSEERRSAQRLGGLQNSANLLSTSETLRRREAWKYDLLRSMLERDGRQFQFEYALDAFVFDLVLLDARVLVEFDGEYHGGRSQQEVDLRKDSVAREHGFVVVRRPVVRSTVIDPVTLDGL